MRYVGGRVETKPVARYLWYDEERVQGDGWTLILERLTLHLARNRVETGDPSALNERRLCALLNLCTGTQS